MTPLQTTVAKWLAIILLAFGAGFYLRDVQADRDVASAKLELANGAIEAHQQFEDKIEIRDTANRKLNADYQALQLTASQALNAQLTQNARLASDLGVARGMSLRGSRCVDPTAAGSDAATGVAADDAPVLSGETRQLVFNLRDAILTERAIADGWHKYADYVVAQYEEHRRLHHEVK